MPRILILEDDPSVAEDLALQLQSLGYTIVDCVASGAEALVIARAQNPDLVLIDIVLPGALDGIEVAQALREYDIPFIFITSHYEEPILARAKLTEPYGYLLKPIDSKHLAANVAVAIFKAQAARQSLNRQRLYATLFSFCEAVLATDSMGKIVLVNEAALKLLDSSEAEILGRTLEEVLQLRAGEDDRNLMPDLLATLAQSDLLRRDELRLSRRDGSAIEVALGASRSYTADGQYIGDALLILDMRERNRMLAELYKLSTAAEQTADAVMITDPAGLIEYVNRAFEQVTGYARSELIGKRPSILRSGYHDNAFYQRLWAALQAGDTFRDIFVNRKKDGAVYYEEKTITPLRSNLGAITHFLSVGSDVTQRLQTEERLLYLATHDIQTELPNRALLHDRLDRALLQTLKSERTIGALFVGIDRFKMVNETLGHSAGDICLKTLAARFHQCLRPGDTVARFGGDVFAVLLDNVASADDIAWVTRNLLQSLSAPITVRGQEIVLTVSIGVSTAPQDFTSREDLLRSAETAMDKAKADGGNRYQFFTSDMNARAFLRLTMEAALRRALERNEFVLYFQPIVALSDGHITGFEALVRWQSPEFGLVLPDAFIPLLEETRLILPVGIWILEEACMQQAAWEKHTGQQLTMAVNFSPAQIHYPDLVNKIADSLSTAGTPPQRLYLEVTESLFLRHLEQSSQILRGVADLGVNIALDDFGTGYSSLSYLTQLPVNTLKIDRSFVREVPANMHHAKVAQGILALGQSLGLRTVGEGVETLAQEQFLREHHCAYAQGYLYGKPMPALECGSLLSAAYLKAG